MRNLTFRGYAQNKGFDPLRVPDQTWKLQRETEIKTQSLRDIRTQNSKNRGEFLNRLESKHFKEADQSAKNFKSKQDFDKAFQDGVLQNIQQKYLDYGVKAQEHQRKAKEWERLTDLIPQAVGAYVQAEELRFNAAVKEGTRKYRSAPEYVKKNWNLLANAKATDAALNPLRDQFADFDQNWHMINNMKPWQKYGAVASHIKDYGKYQLAADINALANSKTLVDDKGKNLAQNRLSKDNLSTSPLFAQVDVIFDNVLDTKFPADQYSEHLYNEVIVPALEEHKEQLKLEISQEVAGNRKETATNIRNQEFYDELNVAEDIGQGFVSWIQNGSNPKDNLDVAEQQLGQLLESGKISDWQLSIIKNQDIEIDGKKYKVGKRWEQRFHRLDDIVTARGKKLADRRQAEMEGLSGNLADKKISFEQDQGRKMRSNEWKQHILNELDQNNVSKLEREKYFPWVKAGMAEQKGIISDQEEMLELLEMDGNLKRFHLLKVDPSIRQKWLDRILGTDKLTDSQKTDFNQIIELQVKESGGGITTVPGLMNTQNKNIARKAKRELWSQYPDFLIKNDTMDPYAAAEKLAESIRIKIEKGLGGYAREIDPITKTQYVGKKGKWISAHDPTSFRLAEEYADKTQSDPTSLNRPGFLEESDVEELVAWHNGRSSKEPDFLEHLAVADKTRTKFQIKRDIINAEFGKVIKAEGTEKIIQYVPAQERKYLQNCPSLAKTYWTLDVNNENHKAIAQMEINPAYFEFNQENPYGVVETGQGLQNIGNLFGIEESQVTIGNLIDLGNRNMAQYFGAYGMSTNTLKKAVSSGQVQRDEYFTPELQDGLKGEMLYDESSVFFINAFTPQPIPGCGKDLGTTQSKNIDEDMNPDTEAAVGQILDLTKMHPVMYEYIKTLTDIK